MKRILMVAGLATLLAAGCQKTEVINPMDSRLGLTFTTEFGKLTKGDPADADGDGMENLQAQDFRIWAYAAHDFDNTPENDANQIYDGINNIKVHDYTSDGTTGVKWKPEKQYFWPGVGKSLYFFAVSDTTLFLGSEGSPATTSHVNIKLELEEGEDEETVKVPSLTVKDYVVDPNNPNNDLMVANFVKQHQDQSEKKVNLKFNHTLSKVQFRFKTNQIAEGDEPINVFVQKLEVGQSSDGVVTGGLKNKGKLEVTVKETTSGTGTTAEVSTLDFVWTLGADLAVFTDDYEDEPTDFPTVIDDVQVVDGDGTDKSAMKLTTTDEEFATWLVLPQDVKGKKVKVTYLINKRQFTNEFNLDAFTDSDNNENTCMWDVNQFVKYTINLSPNLITFDADVTDWTDPATNVPHQN